MEFTLAEAANAQVGCAAKRSPPPARRARTYNSSALRASSQARGVIKRKDMH